MLFVPQLLPGQAVCWERVGFQEPDCTKGSVSLLCCPPPSNPGWAPGHLPASPQPTAALTWQVTHPLQPSAFSWWVSGLEGGVQLRCWEPERALEALPHV